jgi:hypothetical protein
MLLAIPAQDRTSGWRELTQRAPPFSVAAVSQQFFRLFQNTLKICTFAGFLLLPAVLAAQEVSLDLGGGVKMEFVWVPVGGPDGTASV